MDEKIKSLLQQLSLIINEALSDTPAIKAIIQDIRAAGYEVMLTVEASVSTNARNVTGSAPEAVGSGHNGKSKTRLKMTAEDIKFLKSLKIAIDKES